MPTAGFQSFLLTWFGGSGGAEEAANVTAGFRSLLAFWLGGGGGVLGITVGIPTVYPPIASGDHLRLYAVPETTFAVQPTLSATIRNTPLTSMKGGHQFERRAANRYRRDNQREDSLVIRQYATAHIDFELRPDGYHDLLAATCGAALFQVSFIGVTDAYVDATTRSFVVIQDVDWLVADVRPGMWVETSGFYFAANNGRFEIVGVSSTTLTVAQQVVDESPASTESHSLVVGFRIVHGRSGGARRTYFLEAQFTDVDLFEQYAGMQPSTFSLDLRPRSIIEGSVDFVGAHANTSTVGVLNPTFLCADRGHTPFDTSNSILALLEADTALAVPVTALTLHVENSAETIARISQLDPYGVRLSAIAVSGTLQAYFVNATMKQKFLTSQKTSLQLQLRSREGDTLIVSLPHVTLLTGETNVEGRDRDVFASFSWEATVDAGVGYTISVDAFSTSTFTYLPFSSGVPLAQYFRMRDQTGVFWRYWVDTAGELSVALDSDGFILLDETPTDISPGVVPFWHQVTDELGGTWYLYPDTVGELGIASSPPAFGTGLVVGLGQQVRGVDHALYRIGVGSEQAILTQTMDLTGQNVPRIWYVWFHESNSPTISRYVPLYIPGFIPTSAVTGTPPAFYQFRDGVGGTTRYVSMSTSGVLTVSTTLPGGVGRNVGDFIDVIDTNRLVRRLTINSGVLTIQMTGSLCGV